MNDVNFLEDMLFRSLMREVEERYEDVVTIYKYDFEIRGLAEKLMKLAKVVEEVFKEIPNPEKKLDESIYTTLYNILKDISSILYDLSIATNEQVSYVLLQAYRKLDNIDSLIRKLR
ncbi:MAG: hypothetical protein GXO04_04815 [Aquificae bacterium]|nr:hypothetical protein [Aquificota bacterium]